MSIGFEALILARLVFLLEEIVETFRLRVVIVTIHLRHVARDHLILTSRALRSRFFVVTGSMILITITYYPLNYWTISTSETHVSLMASAKDNVVHMDRQKAYVFSSCVTTT